MERGRHGGKAEGRRVRNRPCDVAHRSEVCGSRTLLGPCVASSSLGMLYGSRGALGPSWGRAWQHREVPSPVRAYPCLCRSEPQVRIIRHSPMRVCRFKTKLVINTTRPPPITSRASTCIIAWTEVWPRFNTLFVTKHDAEPVQYNAQILLHLGGLTSHPDPQASRVEGGERWKLERSLPGVRFSTARASVPFRFRALAARSSPVSVRRKCRRGASPETPPDFYGDATRIGVASRVGSSIVNDQWRWGRTIGVHSASVPATAPRSASARSLAATSSFA